MHPLAGHALSQRGDPNTRPPFTYPSPKAWLHSVAVVTIVRDNWRDSP